jgi:hypothetical protein
VLSGSVKSRHRHEILDHGIIAAHKHCKYYP